MSNLEPGELSFSFFLFLFPVSKHGRSEEGELLGRENPIRMFLYIFRSQSESYPRARAAESFNNHSICCTTETNINILNDTFLCVTLGFG